MILTKKDLQRIQELHRTIQRDKDQVYILHELASGTGSQSFDNVRVQSTPSASSGNRYAEAAADLDMRIKAEEEELEYLQMLVEKFIETLEDDAEIRIMQLRYLNCYTWLLISRVTGYVIRHIYRIHDKAIENMPEG